MEWEEKIRCLQSDEEKCANEGFSWKINPSAFIASTEGKNVLRLIIKIYVKPSAKLWRETRFLHVKYQGRYKIFIFLPHGQIFFSYAKW